MRAAYLNWQKDERFRKIKLGDNDIPVALRWTTHPEFGFPRKPFKVFRRPATYAAEQVIHLVQGVNEPVTVTRTFPFGTEMYVMAVSCTVAPGQSLLLTPIGRDNVEMKAKAYRMETSGTILFKAPFMKGLLCEGLGWVTNLAAVPMSVVMQATTWQHIQTVGFPFAKNEVGGLGYESDPQGFVGAETSGEQAARMRLQLGEWLFLPPGSINAADSLVPDVAWRHPDPDAYLNMLQNDQLKMINNCLRRSDDFSYDRSRRQVAFLHKMTIPGISQTGATGTPQDANVVIPVVQHTVMSVSNESPAALGLGFGTYDFASLRQLNATPKNYSYMAAAPNNMVAAQNFMGFDYMVTAEYVIRPFDSFELPFLDSLSKQVSFCALNDERSRPVSPAELVALGLQLNRPEQMDKNYTESVKLRWAQSNVPHGFAAVASYKSGEATVLNDPYPFGGASYQNFFTPVPKIENVQQDAADIGKFVMIHTDEPVPPYHSEIHKYFVAGWDVFGRWTPWVKCGHTAIAPPPQKPGILSIRLNLADPDNLYSLPPANPDVPCQLEIEFAWDWTDRSPAEIQIAGRFFNAAQTTPPASVPSGFARSASEASPVMIRLVFSSANPTVMPTTNMGSIHLVTTAPPPPGSPEHLAGSNEVQNTNLKRYKLVIPGVTAHFTGMAPNEVAYSAFIRGLERVRVPVDGWSAWENGFTQSPDGTVIREGGYVTRLADPRPPAVTEFPATVLFTAVPDATKTARGKLSWPAASGALSYAVWEASETAVRASLGKVLEEAFADDEDQWLLPLSAPLVDRATQLRNLLSQAKYRALCQRSFSRLSKEPVKTTEYELQLPGSADCLYLYQVSSINSANIESAKSNTIFFAVPKVMKPEAPMLQVRPYKKKAEGQPDENGFEIKVVYTIGQEPLGYNLYRTRKKIMSNDPGMKGLPVLEYDAPQWADTTIDMLDGTQYSGKSIKETSLSRSWKPLVYQAVAIGKADPARGRISGESDGSTTEIVYFPPDAPPSLINTATSGNSLCQVFTLQSNAPFHQLEIGKTIIEVYAVDDANQRSLLRTFVAHETRSSNTPMPPATTAAEAAQLPKMQHAPTNNATGITEFSIALAGANVQAIVRITDPLNRASETYLKV